VLLRRSLALLPLTTSPIRPLHQILARVGSAVDYYRIEAVNHLSSNRGCMALFLAGTTSSSLRLSFTTAI